MKARNAIRTANTNGGSSKLPKDTSSEKQEHNVFITPNNLQKKVLKIDKRVFPFEGYFPDRYRNILHIVFFNFPLPRIQTH